MFIPAVTTNEEIEAYPKAHAPMSESAREFILFELYPDILDGSYGYTTQYDRSSLLVKEMSFTCNTQFPWSRIPEQDIWLETDSNTPRHIMVKTSPGRSSSKRAPRYRRN